jgi:OOP family OmpA-OmpF porin
MAKGFIRIVSLSCVLAVSLTACTNGRPEPLACAAIGALAGGAGGAVAYTHADGESDWETAGVGVGSAVLLGAAGYFICKALQKEEAVAETPPPPPPAPMREPEAVAEKIVLRGVNFDFDKSNIRPDAEPILEEAAKTLKDESQLTVSVNGYTDAIGTAEYNQRLSERRADSVRNYLEKLGVAGGRLTAKGFGKSNPVATNDTAEGRAQNRRVELIVNP